MAKRSSTRKNITVILQNLSRSEGGKILLLNLNCCLEKNMLVAKRVMTALESVKRSISASMSAANLLGHLKAVLQRRSFGLHLQHNRDDDFLAFASTGYIVTVMLYDDYGRFYADPSHSTYGHAFAHKTPGTKSGSFLSTARTNEVFWAAPVPTFPDPTVVTSNAEAARDILGLVHYGARKELIALHFVPSPARCYRPTVIEAISNSRFRQTSPLYPAEIRWGYTVDMAKLEAGTGPKDDITGVPEFVFEQVLLKECTVDGFYYLDRTLVDRGTNELDNKFVKHLLQENGLTDISDVIKSIERKLFVI